MKQLWNLRAYPFNLFAKLVGERRRQHKLFVRLVFLTLHRFLSFNIHISKSKLII